MNISKGLYEVITSKSLTLDEKIEVVRNFTIPTEHLDGPLEGFEEPGEITTEDAELIIEALKNGKMIEKGSSDGSR